MKCVKFELLTPCLELDLLALSDITAYLWQDLVILLPIENFNPAHEGTFHLNVANAPSVITFDTANSGVSGQGMQKQE
jgi:hypothetical protein